MTPGEGANGSGELDLAHQALGVARLALDAGALEDAVSRTYYAAFHAARAALTVRGLYAKTHGGTAKLFGQTYGDAATLSDLLEQRGYADYQPSKFALSADAVRKRIEHAATFVARCGGIVEAAQARGPDEPDPPPDL